MADPTRTRTIRVEMTIGLDDRDGRAVISTRDGELGSMPREDFLAMVAREFGVSILFPAAAEPPEPDQAESVPAPTPDPAQTATGDSDGRPVRQCRRTEAHDPHNFLTTRGVVQWCRCAGVATPPEPDRYAAMVEAAATARRRANGWPWEDGPEERRDRYRRSIRTVLDAAGVPALLAELDGVEAEVVHLRWMSGEHDRVGRYLASELKARAAERDTARAERDKARSDLGKATDLMREQREELVRLRTLVGVEGASADWAGLDRNEAIRQAELAATDRDRLTAEVAEALAALYAARAERDKARAELYLSQNRAASRLADADRLRTERDAALAALAGVTPENYHTELRDRRNDDMEVRGILSPNGGPRVIAVEIGPTIAPAVEWLVSDRDSWRGMAEAFRPVVHAARAWREMRRGVPTQPKEAAARLITAVDALDNPVNTSWLTLDNTNARFQPDGWLAISTPITLDNTDGRYEPTEPRTWAEGDPEPGPEVRQVRDRQGDRWKRRKGAWQLKGGSGTPWRWGQLAAQWAPLTDATRKVTG